MGAMGVSGTGAAQGQMGGTGAEEVARDVAALASYAMRRGLIEEGDRTWACNQLLAACGQTGPAPLTVGDAAAGSGLAGGAAARTGVPASPPAPADSAPQDGSFDLQTTLARLTAAARAAHVTLAGHDAGDADFDDALATHLMGILTPRPSQVTARFHDLLRAEGPQAATDWFYALCCDANYVRRSAIARDVRWVTPTRWGDLQITINLSKPEKDPRAIAAAATAHAQGAVEPYPACALCMENEGYAGRGALAAGGAHPSRENLRVVPLELGGERWGLQYSPYAYFPEHCIVMSARHEPMRVDRAALGRLLDFVDLLPHYLVGSNAGLPVVGGSILSHEHFQGGRHTFPMELAPISEYFSLPGFPEVRAGVVRWPLTVMRLACADRAELLDAAAHVLDAWRAFDAPEVGIVSHAPDGTPHNTVTPIVRRLDAPAGAAGEGGAPGRTAGGPIYVMHLALRCNVTSPEFPLGVFHPHPELHHIKRENIGLIEVMGLAVLPARLERELTRVGRALLAGATRADLEADPLCAAHAAWACAVAARHPELAEGTARAILRDEVGQVFARVLEDAGVLKWDAPGRAALHDFLREL